MNKDKEFDDIFRKGLEDPVDEPGYREEDWSAMEQMLDGQKKRRGIVFWLPILSSAAALLLLFLGWWSFRVKTADHPQNYTVTSHKKEQGHTGTGGGPIRQTTEPKPNTALSAGYATNAPVRGTGSGKSNAFLPQYAAGSRRDTTGQHAGGSKRRRDPRSASSAPRASNRARCSATAQPRG